jgi:hypothetical protein
MENIAKAGLAYASGVDPATGKSMAGRNQLAQIASAAQIPLENIAARGAEARKMKRNVKGLALQSALQDEELRRKLEFDFQSKLELTEQEAILESQLRNRYGTGKTNQKAYLDQFGNLKYMDVNKVRGIPGRDGETFFITGGEHLNALSDAGLANETSADPFDIVSKTLLNPQFQEAYINNDFAKFSVNGDPKQGKANVERFNNILFDYGSDKLIKNPQDGTTKQVAGSPLSNMLIDVLKERQAQGHSIPDIRQLQEAKESRPTALSESDKKALTGAKIEDFGGIMPKAKQFINKAFVLVGKGDAATFAESSEEAAKVIDATNKQVSETIAGLGETGIRAQAMLKRWDEVSPSMFTFTEGPQQALSKIKSLDTIFNRFIADAKAQLERPGLDAAQVVQAQGLLQRMEDYRKFYNYLGGVIELQLKGLTDPTDLQDQATTLVQTPSVSGAITPLTSADEQLIIEMGASR